MTNDQLLIIILSIGLPMLAGFGWMFKMIYDLRKDFFIEISDIKKDMTDVRKDINEIKIALGKLEVRVEERTLRVLDKTGSEK